MVRLAQDFAVRYPLIDGQGNFGNVDGDNPAAMRYTESRLTEVAQALLEGLDEDASGYRPPMTGGRGAGRPSGGVPQSVGERIERYRGGHGGTSIPPHNLGELCAASIALIENPNTQDRTLFKSVRGPDFPTGGILSTSRRPIAEAYKTGRGSFRVRARWNEGRRHRGTYQCRRPKSPIRSRSRS